MSSRSTAIRIGHIARNLVRIGHLNFYIVSEENLVKTGQWRSYVNNLKVSLSYSKITFRIILRPCSTSHSKGFYNSDHIYSPPGMCVEASAGCRHSRGILRGVHFGKADCLKLCELLVFPATQYARVIPKTGLQLELQASVEQSARRHTCITILGWTFLI